MRRETIAGGIRLTTERGTVTVTRPAPHVELVRGEGYATTDIVEAIVEQRELILREAGKIALFDDLEHMTGYDSGVRVRLTEWSRENRSRIVAFHILTRSKLAAMGVTVANLALGGQIRAHVRREGFELALTEVLMLPEQRASGTHTR